MDPKGHVLIKREFVATKMWPNPQFTLSGEIDLEAVYKKALAGNLVAVLDVAVDDSGYLVLCDTPESGAFIWTIEKEDTVPGSFIPVIMKYGTIMPAGLSPMEEFAYLAKNLGNITKKYEY